MYSNKYRIWLEETGFDDDVLEEMLLKSSELEIENTKWIDSKKISRILRHGSEEHFFLLVKDK